MEAIFKDFGVQPVLLAAQVVNFLVLLFLLKRFLYRPILKVLEQRRVKVAKSLKDASEIEARLAKTVEDQDKILAQASKEAQGIVENATRSADQIIQDAQLKATQDIQEMMDSARVAITQEKEGLIQEVRAEAANLISLGLEKITGKVLTGKDQENLVKKSIKDM